MATPSVCSIHDCQKPVAHRGLCAAHYKRLLRHGDPLAGRTFEGVPVKYFRETVLGYEGTDCLIWPFTRNPHGYAIVGQRLASRIACEARNGPPPTSRHQAAHLCGNGHLGCVTKAHLVWKTHTENQADRITHGRSNRGDRAASVKLTAEQVRQIRSLRGAVSQEALATSYGVSRGAISHIMNRTSWGWLE